MYPVTDQDRQQPDAQSEEPERIEVLALLARRGAYAVAGLGSGGQPQVLIQRGASVAVAGTLTPTDFAAALDRGWIAASQPPGTFRLTPDGRGAVRRALSERQRNRATSPPEMRAAAPSPVPDPLSRTPAVNDAESPLAWLRARRDSQGQPMLTAEQFDAGERLRADLWRAHMTPRVTASWNGIPQSRGERRAAPGSGIAIADTVVAARRRIEHAFKAVGPEHFDLLF